EWEHAVLVRRRGPFGRQLRDLLRMSGCEVDELVRILREVVELPDVVLEGQAALMTRDQPPLAIEIAALAAELEILCAARRGFGAGKRGQHTRAFQRLQPPAAIDLRALDPGRLE